MQSSTRGRMKNIIVLVLVGASLFATPRAVAFDFGGVMVGTPDRKKVEHFVCESFQMSESDYEKANLEKHQAAESGVTDEQFWMAFARKKGICLSADWPQQYKTAIKGASGANAEMYALVEELKEKNVPVALLSNVDERHSKMAREIGLYQPFAPCLLSCEIGVEKPDPRAYEILLRQLNLPSADVVFIDDNQENVAEAQKIGLDAILFQSPDQVRSELKKRALL